MPSAMERSQCVSRVQNEESNVFGQQSVLKEDLLKVRRIKKLSRRFYVAITFLTHHRISGRPNPTLKSLKDKIEQLSETVLHSMHPGAQPGAEHHVTISPLEQDLNDHLLVSTYMSTYAEHAYPVLIDPPMLDPFSPSLTPSQRLFLTSLMTMGAKLASHSHYEDIFMKSARRQLADLIDEVDPFVAASYGVLSAFYNCQGTLDKAAVMNSTACTMVDQLIKKQQRGSPAVGLNRRVVSNGVDLGLLQLNLLQDKLEYVDDAFVLVFPLLYFYFEIF
jgi:hypothetical protein